MKLFDFKERTFYTVSHDEDILKITDKKTSYYIDRFERLFYKNDGFIVIYEKDRYGEKFYRNDSITLDKNDLAIDFQICKVIENYIYFYNSSEGDSLMIMNFDNKKEVRSYKIDSITNFTKQHTDHPFLLSQCGIYNIFTPAPTLSRAYHQSCSTVCSGVFIENGTSSIFERELILHG